MGRREKNIVGLDIGSTKVCTLIAAVRGGAQRDESENGLEPVGLGVAESRGLKRGAIVNIEAAVESIKKSVHEAETMAGCEVETVYVGLSGPHVRSFNSRGVTPIPTRSREIDSEDVRRVIETARAVALAPDREIIHILPQEFIVDDQDGIGDPLGMFGTRLEVSVHIVTSSTTAAQNIITAVNRSGLLVGDTVLEPIAAGEAILTEDEKELGSVLVDIGGGKTNLAIYHHGAVRHTVVVPLGGELFTNDIAVGLRTSIPEAEWLKREQGCAVSSMADNDKVFEVAGVGSRHPRAVAQSVLSDILQPRAEEIVHLVRNEIRAAGYERQAGAGVVLTGGGAMLRGFAELAEDILDMPVRIGTSTGFGESLLEKTPQLMGPEFATVTGLVLYGERRRKTHDFHENSSSGFKKFVTKFRSLL
ncbi:MAG TPA: cell division protein FtsA [Terriglobia bacterium]|nr:cell division protein FtsA [Terriglobia bacterium]